MNLRNLHQSFGAKLADDGIPLQYGDLNRELQAALEASVLLDRSHEGRITLRGKDRAAFLNRMSTNKMIDMAVGECRPTIFTNANARILDRVLVCNLEDHMLLITDPGRATSVHNLLKRQIFFNDDVQLQDLSPETAQFALHGAQADAVMAALSPETAHIAPLSLIQISIQDQKITAIRNKPYAHQHWTIIAPLASAVSVYNLLLQHGKSVGLIPAGSILFNLLRIRAGHPGRVELSDDYIPLELGLWDEVNFAKGCYTGQEIIARMESRAKLAKTLVALHMDQFVSAPASIRDDKGAPAGQLTSCVQAPDGTIYAMAVVKVAYIAEETTLFVGDSRIPARVDRLLGKQPDFIAP
jgi:folate-binding protein YgfZ